ncbi:MAG: exodeoxyribonuclease VII large subunit [Armatimonadetes bacterium]|nr:exodeoxyribonuclease VII large subunit [Armatimonadota bacterium]
MNVWSVRDLTDHVKALLENDLKLAGVAVRGEISNFSRSTNGHCYFVLKDENAQIASVMFRMQSARCRFVPEDGMKVIAFGRVSVYEQRGTYQLVVAELKLDGLGELYAAFVQLKDRLAREGLFEEARKQPLPFLPRRVGIVTSPKGAALQDMLTTLRRRHPGVDVVISPAIVQGVEAPGSVIAALRRLFRLEVDVIIVARGGGSFEELNAFNDEALARAIAACPIPVVSGVGHETDVTICDMVADVRAATPTAAATAVVPDRAKALRAISEAQVRLRQALLRRLERARERLGALEKRQWMKLPGRSMERHRLHLDRLDGGLLAGIRRRHEHARMRLDNVEQRRGRITPARLLERMRARFENVEQRRLRVSPARLLERARARLEALERRAWRRLPERLVARERERVQRLREALAFATTRALERRQADLRHAAARLDAMSPLKVLGRGYAVCRTIPSGGVEGGEVVSCVAQVTVGQELEVRVQDGSVGVRVRDVVPLGEVRAATDAVTA